MQGDEPPKAPPIEPLAYVGGVKVVDIGDLRVARGMSRRPTSSCGHPKLYYDEQERRVWCPDCEQTVDPFDAFTRIVGQFSDAERQLQRRSNELKQAEQHALVSLAAKAVDKIWRGHRMVPICPVCGHGLFPEDFKVGVAASVGRDYGAARRAASGKPVPGKRD